MTPSLHQTHEINQQITTFHKIPTAIKWQESLNVIQLSIIFDDGVIIGKIMEAYPCGALLMNVVEIFEINKIKNMLNRNLNE